jgi:hypothetical protein
MPMTGLGRSIPFLLLTIVGCADTTVPPNATAVPGRPVSRSETYSQSSDFYWDSGQNQYIWSGQRPAEDQYGSLILDANGIAAAPGTQEFTDWGGNYAGAWVRFRGDEAQNTLDYSAKRISDSHVFYNASNVAGGWHRGDENCGPDEQSTVLISPDPRTIQVCRIHALTTLNLLELDEATCGVKVTVNAKHEARRSLPFGLSPNFGIAAWVFAVGVSGPSTWSPTPQKASQQVDSYHPCADENECDDPTTETVETECTPGSGDQYIGSDYETWQPNTAPSGPVEVCYFTDWYSHAPGDTNRSNWKYIGTDFNGCFWETYY